MRQAVSDGQQKNTMACEGTTRRAAAQGDVLGGSITEILFDLCGLLR